jgi:hypothetical protein
MRNGHYVSSPSSLVKDGTLFSLRSASRLNREPQMLLYSTIQDVLGNYGETSGPTKFESRGTLLISTVLQAVIAIANASLPREFWTEKSRMMFCWVSGYGYIVRARACVMRAGWAQPKVCQGLVQ